MKFYVSHDEQAEKSAFIASGDENNVKALLTGLLNGGLVVSAQPITVTQGIATEANCDPLVIDYGVEAKRFKTSSLVHIVQYMAADMTANIESAVEMLMIAASSTALK